MPRTVVLDEVHLTFRIPTALSEREVRAIRRVLNSMAFSTALRRAVLSSMKTHDELKPVRVRLTR